MKKLFFLFIAAGGAFTSFAQTTEASTPAATVSGVDSTQYLDSLSSAVDTLPRKWKADSLLSRWVLDINGVGGMLTQDITSANTLNNYTNYVGAVSNAGKLKFTNGMTYGADINIGYFPGHKGHWGFGAGFQYLYQQGDLTLDQYHVEYQSSDALGTFRQVVTANQPIKEQLVITNMNVPLLLKYKNRFTRHSGFTAEAGVLYNVQYKHEYKTDASFDYEGIYQFGSNGDGSTASTYDNGASPASTDWYVTKANVRQSDVASYFNEKRAEGLNVGLAQTPTKTKSTSEYDFGNLGLMGRMAYSFYFSDHVALNLGVFYIYHEMKNDVANTYRLTDKVGDYNSLTNSESKVVNQSYGFNLGLRFYLGHYTPKNMVSPEMYRDSVNPSICGLADGSILLHGLKAGEAVAIGYLKDGVSQPVISDSVSAFGTVKMPKLTAGSYTGIVATVGFDTFNYAAVTLVNPPLGYFSESFMNPTATGTCDGTITMHGLHPGLPVTINYSFNSAPQTPFKGVLASDGTVILPRLCAGNYSNILVEANTCQVHGVDMMLASPPPPPPPAPATKPSRPDITTPILFDVNKTTIHESSYPILLEAVIELNEDASASIVIDGFTDITGRKAYNKALSLRRANAVKAYLMRNGVSASRLQTVGHGIDNPIGDNNSPEGRAKNRRVNMSMKHTKGGIQIRRD